MNTEVTIIRRKQAAEMLGVSIPTLWRWEHSGAFPKAVRIGPNASGYLLSDIQAWLEVRKTEPPKNLGSVTEARKSKGT